MSEGEANRIVGPHFDGLFQIVSGAWSEYAAEYSDKQRKKHSQTTRANIVHDLMVSAGADYFSKIETSRVLDINRMKVFTIEDGRNQVAIRFKKFDRQLLSHNIPTKQATAFRGQQHFEDIGRAFNLEAGYMLDRHELEIEQISLVCPNGDGIFWDIRLTAARPISNVHDIFEMHDVDENVDIVRPKDDGKENADETTGNDPEA